MKNIMRKLSYYIPGIGLTIGIVLLMGVCGNIETEYQSFTFNATVGILSFVLSVICFFVAKERYDW